MASLTWDSAPHVSDPVGPNRTRLRSALVVSLDAVARSGMAFAATQASSTEAPWSGAVGRGEGSYRLPARAAEVARPCLILQVISTGEVIRTRVCGLDVHKR